MAITTPTFVPPPPLPFGRSILKVPESIFVSLYQWEVMRDWTTIPRTEQVHKITITPDIAHHWLTYHNNKNRPVSEHIVNMYCRDLNAKKWPLMGDMISFDWDGEMINGQHRCEAIEKTGIPLTAWVYFGADPAIRKITDRQRKRQSGQQYTMDGLPEGKTISAILSNYLAYQNHIYSHIGEAGSQFTDYQRDEVLQDYFGIIVRLPEVAKMTRAFIPCGIGGFLYWQACLINAEKAPEIWEQIATGANIERDSAVHQLYLRLQANKHPADRDPKIPRNQPRALDGTAIAALFIRAFNAMIQNKTIKLRWNGLSQDTFPRFWGEANLGILPDFDQEDAR